MIAEIYNTTATTGDGPVELTLGLLNALQKPGKPKGPIPNLRPVIILSMLRKILAICMKKRIGDRLDNIIPPTQAAYRRGRSTTEHVFAAKILAEKAITSKDHPIYILMLDMSKAFDTVNRQMLLDDLSTTINSDELHMISVMLQTKLRIQCDNSLSDIFDTNTGVPQGDGLSANEFTYYLAKTLQPKHDDHNYCKLHPVPTNVLHDHAYSRKCSNFTINMEYADDLTAVSTNPLLVEQIKRDIPPKLGQRGLTINNTKTEEYTITHNGDSSWKKCKLLGSLLDTESDIDRRKGLAIAAINSMKSIFHGNVSLHVKVKSFDCYAGSIFLYNSELWTLTESLKSSIDSFHRRLLRSACLNVKWPNVVKNENVYALTKARPWSEVIEERQLRWLGHMVRLPDDTPAKLALTYSMIPEPKPRGGQKLTWIKSMQKNLEKYNTTWPQAMELAKNREVWRDLIKRVAHD